MGATENGLDVNVSAPKSWWKYIFIINTQRNCVDLNFMGNNLWTSAFSRSDLNRNWTPASLNDYLKGQYGAGLMFVYNEIRYRCDMDIIQPPRHVRAMCWKFGEDKIKGALGKRRLKLPRKKSWGEKYFAVNCGFKCFEVKLKHPDIKYILIVRDSWAPARVQMMGQLLFSVISLWPH